MKNILIVSVIILVLLTSSILGLILNSTRSVDSVDAKKGSFSLSQEIEDLSLLPYGIMWTPDSHISYISLPNGIRRYFISGNQRTYYIDVAGSQTLEEAIKDNPILIECFGPDINVPHKNGYSTIASVLQTDEGNPYHVIGIAQNEAQKVNPDGSLDFANFTTSISLLESYNGGASWKDYGPVIRGDDFLEPGTRITGAGHPSAAVIDGYVYVYYVDWPTQIKVVHPAQIYLARAQVLPDGKVSNFEFYKDGGFSLGEFDLKPVIPAGTNTESEYTSLPSVSYNESLKKYLAIYETNFGFSMAVSSNGINWSGHKTIFDFPKPQIERQFDDIWYSYPSLLSDGSQPNDQITDETGNLYFSKGFWPNTAHQLIRKSFSFK